MKRLATLGLLLFCLSRPETLQANGIVIPKDQDIPPLAMVHHRVQVMLNDQVAITKVQQTFRNHTDRQLEATYIFPVPRGASVKDFAMYIDGRRVVGEKVEAGKARHIYNEIVRRSQDPGLLEYIGHDLLQMRIFPILAKSDQKVEVTFTSIAQRDQDLVEYVYPLRTVGRAAVTTLEDFSLKLTLKSTTPILNIYSPTHAIAFERKSDNEVLVTFEKQQVVLDRDFQLYYTVSKQDVGLTALQHRPITTEDGYFLLLISPRAELKKEQQAPRDMVFVLDTSGSMREDDKLDQAKKALKHGLHILGDKDRFAIMSFATTVNHYRPELVAATKDQLAEAAKWIDSLEPSGGTAISDALDAAFKMQSSDSSRTFTLVLLTDGKPTIGETDTDKILKQVHQKNTGHTRIFTFGVGNDLNAAFLDQLSDQTRALSTYVQPKEDMELKVSMFFTRISQPVLTNLKVVASNVRLQEIYPPQLPDLFQGGQLVIMGRYTGTGTATVKLTGTVGAETREYTYQVNFAPKAEDKPFVEELWGRRKAGYLLEQIRLNGEKKELVDEVIVLAKKYGIATPYTSYLIVPDQPLPMAGGGGGRPGRPGLPGRPGVGGGNASGGTAPLLLGYRGRNGGGGGLGGDGKPMKLADVVKQEQKEKGEAASKRGGLESERLDQLAKGDAGGQQGQAADKAVKDYRAQNTANQALRRGQNRRIQTDQVGVNLSEQFGSLKNQTCLTPRASQNVQGRNCVEYGGVWIDEGYEEKTATCVVKTMSDAYFRILERHPEVKEVFQLGNYLVWVTPSGTALILDLNDGKDKLGDEEIDKLFAKR